MNAIRSSVEGPANGRRYRLMVVLASAAIFWERLWPRLWPSACILAAFVGIALLDLLPALPHWLHAGVLGLFVAGFAATILRARPALRKVRHEAARSRLERDSGLVDHPLAALEDRLAAGRNDRLAEAMWRRHRERMAAGIGRLRVRLPRPETPRRNCRGLRAGALLLLVIGLVVAGSDAGSRLLRAVDAGFDLGRRSAVVELWITPPPYTGAAPTFVSTAGTHAATEVAPVIRVPRGSKALVRAGGIGSTPVLTAGGTRSAFAPLAGDAAGGQAWRAEVTIDSGDRLLVRAGRRQLASWPMQVVADAPPTVGFEAPPASPGNGSLSLAYSANDDYGVTEVTALIDAADESGAVSAAQAVRLALPVATPEGSAVAAKTVQDLSDSPFAGQSVRVSLEAKDAAGQIGRSGPSTLVLSERTFTHPVARAIVDLRKRLLNGDQRRPVADGLAAIAAEPERFDNDAVVSLALAVAKARLRLDEGAGGVSSVRDLLWQTALRIEQGEVPFAERQVEEARQRLLDALQRGAEQAELERLMDELQAALDRYLAAVATELARQGPVPAGAQAHILNSDDLKQLVETARQLARTGGRDAARQLLAQLERALESIRSGLGSRGSTQDVAEAQALMQTLRDLADRQQKLLDDSFEQLRRSQAEQDRAPRDRSGRLQGRQQGRPQAADPAAKDSAATQQALRGEVGELMLRMNDFLGSIPRPLGEAEQAMGGAVRSLERGRLGEAVPEQTRAVDALSRAIETTGPQVAQRLGLMLGLSGEGEGDGGSNDIFGRSPDGQRGFATGPLQIPDRSELQRAQEILEELRRRAAERFRPPPELDYIDRLLRHF